jgi:hypothetical protein
LVSLFRMAKPAEQMHSRGWLTGSHENFLGGFPPTVRVCLSPCCVKKTIAICCLVSPRMLRKNSVSFLQSDDTSGQCPTRGVASLIRSI